MPLDVVIDVSLDGKQQDADDTADQAHNQVNCFEEITKAAIATQKNEIAASSNRTISLPTPVLVSITFEITFEHIQLAMMRQIANAIDAFQP